MPTIYDGETSKYNDLVIKDIYGLWGYQI